MEGSGVHELKNQGDGVGLPFVTMDDLILGTSNKSNQAFVSCAHHVPSPCVSPESYVCVSSVHKHLANDQKQVVPERGT